MEFSNIYLFDGISTQECCAMMDCFHAENRHFEKGEIICNCAAPKQAIGILEKGEALVVREDIEGNRTILECLQEKNVFGEVLAFSCLEHDNIFIICEKSCDVLFIDYEAITKRCKKACLHHTRLVENLFSLIAQKALSLSERVEVLSRRTIRGKLMCYFAITSNKNDSRRFELPFSVTALAEYLCVDRSAMVREIGNMKKEGLLEMDRRYVEIKNFVV